MNSRNALVLGECALLRSQDRAAEFVRFNPVDKAHDPRILVIGNLNLTVQRGESLCAVDPWRFERRTRASFDEPIITILLAGSENRICRDKYGAACAKR